MGKASHEGSQPPSGAVPGVIESAATPIPRGAPMGSARRPSVVVLGAVTTIAAGIGILPWLDITERGIAAALLVGLWLFVSVMRARVLVTSSDNHPTVLELAIGVVSSLFPASLVSAAGLLVYGVVLGVAVLARALGADLDTSRGSTAETIAFAASCVMAFAFCPPSAILATDNTSQQLYPRTAGLKAAYTSLRAERKRRRKVALLGIPAIFLGVIGLFIKGGLIVIGEQIFVLLWSAMIFSLGRPDRTAEDQRTTMSLAEAFAQDGFQVVEAPRTGDPAVDPLLVCVDLLAYDRERAFAVQLKTASGTVSKIPWADAASIELAASTLADVAWQLDIVAGQIEPVLVLTGEEPDKALVQFAEREHVHLVVFPESQPPAEELAHEIMQLRKVEASA